MSSLPDFVRLHKNSGYGSELESEQSSVVSEGDVVDKRKRQQWMLESDKQERKALVSKERSQHYRSVMAMDPVSRHRQFIRDMVWYGGEEKLKKYIASNMPAPKTDRDVLKEEFRFLRTEADDVVEDSFHAWRKHMARKYYDKLFKEYCIADMSRYKEGKLGLRWRVEKEVVAGKGQFICGNKACSSDKKLQSFEVPFSYVENGEHKSALVKLRVCPSCARKLNFKFPHAEAKYKREERKRKAQEREERKRREKRRRKSGGSGKDDKGSDKGSDSDEDSSEGEGEGEGGRGEGGRGEGAQQQQKQQQADESVWRQRPQMEASIGDEMDDYFSAMCGDLLL